MRRDNRPVMQVIKAGVVSLGITFIGLTVIFIWALLSQGNQFYAAPLGLMLAAISVLTGGFLAGSKAVQRGWLHGAMVGNLYALMMSGVVSSLYPFGLWDGLTYLLYSIIAGSVGGSLGINLQPKLRLSRRSSIGRYGYYS